MKRFSIVLIVIILCIMQMVNPSYANKVGPLTLLQEDINKHGWGKNSSVLSVEVFEKQMDYINKNGFYTATLDELQDFIDNKMKLPEKTIVITFDDGYYSNALYAYPIMQRYNFRGTIFMMGHEVEKPQKEFNPAKLQYFSLDEAYKYSWVCN